MPEMILLHLTISTSNYVNISASQTHLQFCDWMPAAILALWFLFNLVLSRLMLYL